MINCSLSILIFRYSHCLVADEEYIYAVGGWELASVERFDPQQSNWEVISHMSVPRAGATAVLLNGLIYVSGGRGGNGCLTSMEVWNLFLFFIGKTCILIH